MDWKIALYRHAPTVLRDWMASLHGYYLRSWRYGPETERLIEEYLEHEKWDPVQWKRWQEERLSYLLHRAATQVPYYRDQWNKRRRLGDRASWEYLGNWPILSKDAVRSAPLQFVADDCHIRRMYHEHTSGTTGKPLDLWWSRATVRNWYALFEARCRSWHGVSRRDRWAILGGQLVVPAQQRRPPFWVWNQPLLQLYLSSYHLAADLIPHYFEALKRYKVRYLLGYTSSLYFLAREALQMNFSDLEMEVVLTNAEPILPYQREVISEAFHCPVRETYGMAEIVAAASECPQGRMHLWPEVGILETYQEGASSSPEEEGELICTGLLNTDMPLIRYRVGDRGALGPEGKVCTCGRSLPLVDKIEGRSDDILYTADGRQIGRLDPVFKANLPIIEAQIIQEKLSQITLRFVPTLEYRPEHGKVMVERLKEYMGDIQVKLEPVSELPREANGKFRAVISKVSNGNG